MITLAVLVITAMNGFWLSRTGEIAVATDISEVGRGIHPAVQRF